MATRGKRRIRTPREQAALVDVFFNRAAVTAAVITALVLLDSMGIFA
jgi:hypothetical protein